MKKKILVSLLTLIAGVSLAACNNKTSDSVKPTEQPSAPVTEAPFALSQLQIANKEAFTDYFYVGDSNKKIDIAIDDGKNVASLINEKKITIKSSNENAAKVIGRYVSPVGAGEVTITVSGGGKSDSVSFYVGKKITLVPEDTEVGINQERNIGVDGEDTNAADYEWTSSDATKATVENGVVKGVAEGTVVIEAKLKSNSKEGAKISIKVSKSVAKAQAINTITKAVSKATVRGQILVKAPKFFIIADETAAIEVYTSTNYAVGDVVKVTGKVVAYAKVLEFSGSISITKIGYKVKNPFGKDPIELTKDIASKLANVSDNGTTEYRRSYKWSATATKSGNFVCFNLDGSEILLEPSNASDFNIVLGNYYTVEGVWQGSKNSSYVQFYRTKVVETIPPKTIVRVSASALTFDVGNTRKLSASYILSQADKDKNVNTITWASSNVTKATVDANGVVTAVAEGTVKITATVGETSVEVNITIVAAHAVKKISQLNKNKEEVRVKAIVSSVSSKGAILSDETGSIYAEFDSKAAPSLKSNDYIEIIASLNIYKGRTDFCKVTADQVYVFDSKEAGKPVVNIGKAEEWTKEKGNSYVKASNEEDTTANATPVSEVKLYTWKTTVTTDDKNNLVLALDGAEASDAKNIAYTSIPTIEVGNRYTVTGFFIGFDWGYQANKFFITSVSEITQTRIKFASDYYANGVTVNTGLSSELEYKFTVSDADSVGLTGSDYVNMVSFTSSDETIVKAEKTSSEPDTAGNSKSRLKLTGVKVGSATVTAKITAPAKDGKEAKVLFSKDIAVTVADVSYSKISSTADIKANDEVLLTFSNGGKTYAFAAETLKQAWYLKAVEVAVSDNKIKDVNGASVLTLEAGKAANSYYFHADNGKYLNSAVSGTHYNTLLADKKDAKTSLFSVSFDDKGVLTVKNTTNGVFVSGSVYNGTAEFQGAKSSNANYDKYPLAIYKKA